MMWLTTAFGLIKKSYLGILAVFGIFLLRRNSKLTRENEELGNHLRDNEKVIKVQNEVIHALQNNKPADLDTNIKRMHNKEL